MREEGLQPRRPKAKRGWSSYRGEASEHPGNKAGRDFRSASPNFLRPTDATRLSIPAGKACLSPVVDCFDGMVVSWAISTSPNAEMANPMLRNAVATLDGTERTVIHTDCGIRCRWPEWISICNQAGLTRSMSKKGCCPDNSAMEGFFGRLKVEMFHGHGWTGVGVDEFMDRVDKYIHWYNERRIKRSLGGMSPVDYRASLGLAS